MLHPFLAEEAQLVACSAVIKEIKIQTIDTKTQSSGLSTKINTCTHTNTFTHTHTHTLVHTHRASEFCAAFVKTDSHILTSSDSLSCSGMEKCWKRILVSINYLFIYLFAPQWRHSALSWMMWAVSETPPCLDSSTLDIKPLWGADTIMSSDLKC